MYPSPLHCIPLLPVIFFYVVCQPRLMIFLSKARKRLRPRRIPVSSPTPPHWAGPSSLPLRATSFLWVIRRTLFSFGIPFLVVRLIPCFLASFESCIPKGGVAGRSLRFFFFSTLNWFLPFILTKQSRYLLRGGAFLWGVGRRYLSLACPIFPLPPIF